MLIPIKNLYYLEWRAECDNDLLMFSIAKDGLRVPIQVRRYKAFLWWLRPKKYVVISGNRRVQALKKLCRTEVEAVVNGYQKCPFAKQFKRF